MHKRNSKSLPAPPACLPCLVPPAAAEWAKPSGSAAPRMGVQGVLDSSMRALQLLKFKKLTTKMQLRDE